ncbi:MAG: sulfite exporter TauE/SafE family protein [Deltaproteobacteria bacterium]|nr:sulfite exporter TauE/SafE family protein [Deltaproteobacteria bacterium]MBN2673925.1 sulfite exporter TauE/SafE family protein [Deltaproteobacteria bacterium]
MIALFLLIGVISGTFAGLLGVGGGLIFLPLAKFYFLDHLGYPSEFLKVIIATSTAIIVANSASATIQHHRNRNIDISLLPYFVVACIVGAKLGVVLIDIVPIPVVKCILTTFLIISSLRILRKKKPSSDNRILDKKSKIQIGSVGLLISTLSSMLGLGGGALMGPFLNGVFKQSIKKSIGTASMFTLTVSATACVFYLMQPEPQNLTHHLMVGYIDMQIAVLVAAGGIFGSWMGAKLMHRAPVTVIQKLFAVLLIIAALKITL